MQRAAERLKIVVPLTLAIIFALLYAIFRRFDEAALIMATLPFALRSEEHTSELQSLMRISYAVFCLKKKKKQQSNTTNITILIYYILQSTCTSYISDEH